MKAETLPDWPALMNADMAGAYFGVSASSFEVLAARRGVRPVQLDVRCKRWRRRDLDALIESLPVVQAVGGDAPPAAAPAHVVDLDDDAALARVESFGRRRSGGR